MLGLAVLAVIVAGLLALAWQEDLVESRWTLAVAFAGLAWWAAETPPGLGDGVVPALDGRTSCDGEVALSERGVVRIVTVLAGLVTLR